MVSYTLGSKANSGRSRNKKERVVRGKKDEGVRTENKNNEVLEEEDQMIVMPRVIKMTGR